MDAKYFDRFCMSPLYDDFLDQKFLAIFEREKASVSDGTLAAATVAKKLMQNCKAHLKKDELNIIMAMHGDSS